MTNAQPADRRRPAAVAARDTGDGLGPLEIGMLLAAIAVTAAVLVMPLGPRALPDPLGTRPVRVSQGDSLWSLAERHEVPGLGAPQTARLIRDLNELDNSALSVGQIVLVPADASDAVVLNTP